MSDGARPLHPLRLHGLLSPRVPDADVRAWHGQVPRHEHLRHPVPAQQCPTQPFERPHAGPLRRREDVLSQVSAVLFAWREIALLFLINLIVAWVTGHYAIDYCRKKYILYDHNIV